MLLLREQATRCYQYVDRLDDIIIMQTNYTIFMNELYVETITWTSDVRI